MTGSSTIFRSPCPWLPNKREEAMSSAADPCRNPGAFTDSRGHDFQLQLSAEDGWQTFFYTCKWNPYKCTLVVRRKWEKWDLLSVCRIRKNTFIWSLRVNDISLSGNVSSASLRPNFESSDSSPPTPFSLVSMRADPQRSEPGSIKITCDNIPLCDFVSIAHYIAF